MNSHIQSVTKVSNMWSTISELVIGVAEALARYLLILSKKNRDIMNNQPIQAEILPDSNDLQSVSRYVSAMADALSSIDMSDISDQSRTTLLTVNYHLTQRMIELLPTTETAN